VVDDADLDEFDRDRVLVDSEHTGPLAGSRTQSASEFWEVVGRVESLDCFAPPILVDEVVPVRNDVAQRAAVVAEGNPAIHAATCLLLQVCLGERLVHLLPITKTYGNGAGLRCLSTKLQESSWLTHERPP